MFRFPHFLSLCLLTLLLNGVASCNEPFSDAPAEDYEKLFPFRGIDRPEADPGQIVERQGNPDLNRTTFVYQGDDNTVGDTEYLVTLRYTLIDANPVDEGSRYVIRFVDDNRRLVSITSNENTAFMDSEEYGALNGAPGHGFSMRRNEEYTHTFKARSGFQLLLCVNGFGPRNTGVRASITATSLDGMVVPIRLSTEQYQNKEGHVALPNPFCKYIILP